MTVIIKSLRIRSKSGINRIIRHLQNGNENERVAFLRGTPADIRDMQRDAVARSATYSVRHWIVAPHEATTRAQMRYVLDMLAKEFRFDAGRAVVVEHCKKRSVADASDVHWHVLVGEVDPATGDILRSSFDRVIHELVARVSEYKFGHAFVQGKHTKTVIQGLRKRNLSCIAASLETFIGTETTFAMEAFDHAQHQEKKRLGIDLPALRQAVKNATSIARSRADLVEKLAASGMVLMIGEKPNTWIVRDEKNNLIGALHRLASKRKAEINQLLAEAPALEVEPIEAPPLVPAIPSIQNSQTSVSQTEANISRPGLLDQLSRLEETSLTRVNIEIPDFQESSELRGQRKSLLNKNAELKASRDERWDKFEELQVTEKMKWWFYPLGIAAKRKTRAHRLRHEIETADKNIKNLMISISACESRVYRVEKAEIEAHRSLVRKLANDKKAAQKTLEIIAAAHEFLALHQEAAISDLDSLLEIAELQTAKRNADTGAKCEF